MLTAVAPIFEIEAWAVRLGGPAGGRVVRLLERLSALRRGPDGRALTHPLIMGVVNATPDSFSDGGEHLNPAAVGPSL